MSHVRRRDFITLLGGAVAAWPLAARAQQAERMRRVGVLVSSSESDPEVPSRVTAFNKGLRELGWFEDRNIRIDYRFAAGDTGRMRIFAKELVELRPDVIVAHTTPVVAAVLKETHTIPIVFTTVFDPVGSGFVASLARPGGNVTGFINIEASLAGKWVELLKEIAPGVTRVALMFNPDTAPHARYYLDPFEAAARSSAVNPIAAPVRDRAGIEDVLAALGREPGGGFIVMPDIFPTVHRDLIISLAARHRLPAAYAFRFFATSGGLVSYGIDVTDLYRRAAPYVDRILRGAKAADLPVQVPTKFELVVNLKTGKALGLDVPLHLQQRADEVIE